MKRTFLAKRNALLSSANASWGVGALAFAVVVLLFRLIAPNLFLQTFTPLFRGAETISLTSHSLFAGFRDASALFSLNEKLLEENTALMNEKTILEQQLKNKETLSGKGILAGVFARPPESPYDTLVLGSGVTDGVTLGMEAFGAGGVPLGIVSSVTSNFSRITLFSSPGVVTRGWIGKTHIPIAIFGAGGGVMQATVSRSVEVKEGDTVFVPGPGMLPIGEVVRIDSDPSSPEITIRLKPTLNLFSVTWVELRESVPTFTSEI